MLSYTQVICSALLAAQLVCSVPIPAAGDATTDESSTVVNKLLGPIPILGDHLPSISPTAVKISPTGVPLPQARPIPLEFDETPTKNQKRTVSTASGDGNELLDADSLLGDEVIDGLTSSTTTIVASTSTISAPSTSSFSVVPLPTELGLPLFLNSEPVKDSTVVRTKEKVRHSRKIAGDQGRLTDPDGIFGLDGLFGSLFNVKPNQQSQRSVVTSSGLIGLSQIAEASAKEAAGEP